MDLKKRIMLVFILILLLEYIYATPVSSIKTIGEAEVYAPAVSNIGGVMKGVLTKIKITVTEGTGDVYVATASLTELDMQATARIAAQIACELLNLNFSKYNFLIKVESDSIVVGGPSAGAIMTIGMISALTGWPIREDVLMTGTINPDESIGPVGGIPEKIEAAAQKNIKFFLVPLGQTIVIKYVTVQKRIGPFVFTEVKPIRVNLTEYAREKWNIKVIEVTDIAEAASIFFNKSFIIANVREPKYRQLTEELFSDTARKLIEKARLTENTVREDIKNSYIGANLKRDLSMFLDKKIDKILNDAEILLDDKPYVAASLAFQALVNLQYVDNILLYEQDGFEEIINKTLQTLEDAEELINNIVIDSRKDVELVMAAKYRLEDAKENFIKANKTRDIDEKLYSLAYSMQRAYISTLWANMAKNFSDGNKIELDYVKKIANDYLLMARNSWSYAYTLTAQLNTILEEVSEAEESFEKAKELFEKEEYTLSCAYAIDSIVESELALNKIHLKAVQKNIAGILVNKSREKAIYLLSNAQNVTIPILASSYMEFGDYASDYETKLRAYKLSSYYSKLALQLAKAKISRRREDKYMNLGENKKSPMSIEKTPINAVNPALIVIPIMIIVGFYLVYRRYKKTSKHYSI